MSERKRKTAETGDGQRRTDDLFRAALTVSLALNLAVASALSLVELPERVSSQAEAVPRTALVSYESDAPLPESVIDRDADLLLSGEGPATEGGSSDGSEVERTSARSAERGGGGAGDGSGGGGGDAESAEKAFLSAFGNPSAEGAGGGGVVGDADVQGGGSEGTSAPRIGGPRSGIGEGGGGRSGRQPLSGGGSAVAGRLGPGEGDGGGGGGGNGIERTGSVAISTPGGSGEGEGSGASAEVFQRIGNQVRRNEAQIRFCYQEEGLKQNPELAGTVRVEFDVSGGRVTSATLRSGLSGQGGDATERCILEAIRGWRFADVDESVTVPYTFVLSR